jgi:hypothetical protein
MKAQASEEAGQQQLTSMMDEQLAQSQTIEALRRQLKISNNSVVQMSLQVLWYLPRGIMSRKGFTFRK